MSLLSAARLPARRHAKRRPMDDRVGIGEVSKARLMPKPLLRSV